MAEAGRAEANAGGQREQSVVNMVLANRPWRLVRDLKFALAAALATAAYAVVTSTLWPLADSMGPVRLTAVAILAIALLVTWLVVAHGLWERPSGQADSERVRLANKVTVGTLVIGVACFYAALFVVVTAAALIVIESSFIEKTLGHSAGLGSYLTIAWVAASLATVAGALGSGVETDDSVREALYGYRPESLSDQRRPA
jgi:magnesium-transporting ATPase (P-type)